MNWNGKDANEVALNAIWAEHVDKEKQYMQPKTKFTCNPMSSVEMNNGLGSRVPFVTDKVGYAPPKETVDLGDDPDVHAVVQGLLDARKPPQAKYDAPMTSAQEVGWNTTPLAAPNPRFKHGLAQGESTSFAETYTQKMSGEHMFHGKSGKYLRF
uniref:Uncharacterized protein n=1 Tax=Chrysotila carterae TaxID=13221 RepID=A0A7S4C0N5_CHRCT|mmetsp:Transcript_48351/g.104752  ORF Transcript_48351/g.104752 Transcript_48351/m.104752 type:complete len:155 (+) Transcript_48351:249-713(+)